jgi:hypothetical protein
VKRTRLFAIGWLLGGTVVPAAAAVVILGCCELPFHGLVHRVMPLCEMAVAALAHHDHEADAPAVPAPPRPEAKPSVERAWRAPERPAIHPPLVLAATLPPPAAGAPSLRALPIGAFRCDDDVGTRLAFVETLRL